MNILCKAKKFLSRPSVKIASVGILGILLFTVFAETTTASDNDNFDDLWESTLGQYEKLFPVASMFYIFVLMVLSLGTYMKTNSLGAVTALLVIGGVCLAGAVGDLGRLVFGFFMIISFAFLMYVVYRRR